MQQLHACALLRRSPAENEELDSEARDPGQGSSGATNRNIGPEGGCAAKDYGRAPHQPPSWDGRLSMPQIFSPKVSLWFKTALIVAPFAVVIAGLAAYRFSYSAYLTQVDLPLDQPVPFSHQHHVAGLGIDCQYCHTTVTKTADAGMPDTHTCMTCHSQIWTEAPVLQPVRDSLSSRLPIRWTRVHNLADYVYFNHSIHVNKGISCTKCHGNVESMPILWKEVTLQMGWCLECHRHPAAAYSPPDAVFQPPQVFTLNWRLDANPEAKSFVHKQLAGVPSIRELTDCTTCHR